jgi:hypothetical protein
MAPRGRPKKKFPDMKDLPENFRLSFMKMMVKNDIKDLNLAWERAASILDSNGILWEKSVGDESERKYRSRFMTQFNKARGTIELNAFEEGFDKGFVLGTEDNQVWYYCKVCGKRININPNSEVHKDVIDHLNEKGWGHAECHKRVKK